jgi:hypothetical protein
MEASAAGINRKIGEQGISLETPVTADDIDLSFHVNARVWRPSAFWGNSAQVEAIRMLQGMFE